MLFDGLNLFFQVPFETGDLFLFGPEASPTGEGCATAASITVLVPGLAATTVTTVDGSMIVHQPLPIKSCNYLLICSYTDMNDQRKGNCYLTTTNPSPSVPRTLVLNCSSQAGGETRDRAYGHSGIVAQ